jgi:hypothetical protein
MITCNIDAGVSEGKGHLPYCGTTSSWGSDELTSNSFVFNPHGDGWHLNRMMFDKWLQSEASKRGARFLQGCKASSCKRNSDGSWTVSTQGYFSVSFSITRYQGPNVWVSVANGWSMLVEGGVGCQSRLVFLVKNYDLWQWKLGYQRTCLDKLIALVVLFKQPEQDERGTVQIALHL